MLAIWIAGCGRIGFHDHADAAPIDLAADSVDGPAPSCADLEALRDNFSDGVTDPQWTTNIEPPVTVAETSGTLEIRLLAYGEYGSTCRFDARDKRVFVEVLGVPDPAPVGGEMFFELILDGANRVGIGERQNMIGFYRRIATVYVETPLPFSTVQHRHWQLREASGTMFWETSPDAVTWTVQRMEPTPIDLSNVQLRLVAGTYATSAGGGEAVFDNVNLP